MARKTYKLIFHYAARTGKTIPFAWEHTALMTCWLIVVFWSVIWRRLSCPVFITQCDSRLERPWNKRVNNSYFVCAFENTLNEYLTIVLYNWYWRATRFDHVNDVPREYAMSVCGAVWVSCMLRRHLDTLTSVMYCFWDISVAQNLAITATDQMHSRKARHIAQRCPGSIVHDLLYVVFAGSPCTITTEAIRFTSCHDITARHH